MGTGRQRRVARNESDFREVNERIEEGADRLHIEGRAEFLCECGREDCIERIEMSRAEYEAVRACPTRFAVRPGHEIAETEYVVEQNDRFAVVEKTGAGSRIAEERDPRARPAVGQTV